MVQGTSPAVRNPQPAGVVLQILAAGGPRAFGLSWAKMGEALEGCYALVSGGRPFPIALPIG